MKKFLVVCWFHYYPDPGLDNLKGSYDTLEEAIAQQDRCQYDVMQILDRDSLNVLWERK